MAVAFLNSFLSYLMLMLIIVVLGAIAITLGITLRKRKDAKEALLASAQADTEEGSSHV